MSRPAVKFSPSITRAARKLPGIGNIEKIEQLIETRREYARPYLEGIPSVKCINLALRHGIRTDVIGIVFVDMPLADFIPSAQDEVLVLRVSRKYARIGTIKLTDEVQRRKHLNLITQIYFNLREFERLRNCVS